MCTSFGISERIRWGRTNELSKPTHTPYHTLLLHYIITHIHTHTLSINVNLIHLYDRTRSYTFCSIAYPYQYHKRSAYYMIYMHLTLYLPGPTYLIYLPTCFSICCPVVSVYNVYVTCAYLHTGRTYDTILIYWYTDTRDINVYFMYHFCASTHASETDIQSLFRSDVASLKTWLRDRYLRIVEQATGAASSQDRTRSGSCCYSTLRLTPVTYCHAGFVLCLG